MVKYWHSAQFKKAKDEWEKKLLDSGFQDIEKEVNREKAFKKLSQTSGREGGIFRHHSEVTRIQKTEYFYLLSQFVDVEKNYDDESDRLIMERTADGTRIKEISRELRSLGMRKHNRDSIRYVRRRYEHRWGIRNWKPEEMVSRKIPAR